MSRWLRWQFVLPRLLMVVVLALAAQWAAGLAVRSLAARHGTRLLNAEVDVSHARISPRDGNLLLGSVSVADPRDPGKRWFTAEACELELAASRLLHKQAVISKARMTGVQFGGLPREAASKCRISTGNTVWFNDDVVEAAADKLAKIDGWLDEDILGRLESVRRVTDSCTRWQSEFAALDARAAELVLGASEIEKILDTASSNHLRHDRLPDDLPNKLAALQISLDELSNEFDKLPQRMEEERRSIVAVCREDEVFVRAKMHVERIDPKLLNAYLLREQASPPLDELVAWLRRLRQVAPAEVTPPVTTHRGTNVLFAGASPRASFLIKTLQLQGEATCCGRPFDFRGRISNLTTTPSIHAEPIQLQLSAKGSTTFELRATIDRTRGRVRDELFVDCRDFPLGDQSLGRAEKLELKIAPSTGSLTVSVSVDGDQLSGDIQLVQNQVRMTPAFAGTKDSFSIAESLEQSLGKLDALATRFSLDGTVDQPTCTLWSNLGPAVAEALEHGLRHHVEVRTNAVLADARRHVDERLAELERRVADEREQFANKTASLSQRIDAIARIQVRGERMSAEQAGTRLPTSSILR